MMLSASFTLRIVRGRLLLEVEGQPPAIVGHIITVKGVPCVATAAGETTPVNLEEVKGSR
jgi:hypothetical protein